jgi:hypothetical protein
MGFDYDGQSSFSEKMEKRRPKYHYENCNTYPAGKAGQTAVARSWGLLPQQPLSTAPLARLREPLVVGYLHSRNKNGSFEPRPLNGQKVCEPPPDAVSAGGRTFEATQIQFPAGRRTWVIS